MTWDPAWKPAAGLIELRRRADTLARIRDFFAARSVMEVTTPVLTSAGVSDPHLHSLALAGDRETFLRTSPEYFHKRLLAAGCGDIYELGPVFRASEQGSLHTREFTMLEWYRVGWSWQALADEVLELLRHSVPGRFDEWPILRSSWRDLATGSLGMDPLPMEDAELARVAGDAPPGLDRSERLDWIFAHRIIPALAGGTINQIHDFPAEHAALARVRPDPTPVAERFEIFLGSIELANGYQELTDPDEQRRRIEQDNNRRKSLGLPAMPVDHNLLDALCAGLPECAGVALGVDRMLLAAAGLRDIRQVQAF